MSILEKKREPLSAEDEIRSLLAEGRISEAKSLLESSGDLVPADSKLREIFAPPRITRINKRDVDRTPEFNWFKANWDAYRGKWVAVVGEELVACESSLQGAPRPVGPT